MLCENTNFSSSCGSCLCFPPKRQREKTGNRKRSYSPAQGVWILWWIFINYLCLLAEWTIVLSEMLTFSISPHFGTSYKVHCEREVLTLKMIWRTEIPLSFIINPGWLRGRRDLALTYLTAVRGGHLTATLGNQSPLLV